VPLEGPAIALATGGAVTVSGRASGGRAELVPGAAVLVTPDERAVRVSGEGELFIALPGR
jgi:mannose-6-phosphate isomerase